MELNDTPAQAEYRHEIRKWLSPSKVGGTHDAEGRVAGDLLEQAARRG